MLVPAEPGPSVVVCNSCRHRPDARTGPDGRTGGERLVDALKALQAADPAYRAVAVQHMPCLFACGEHVTVHLRAPGRIGYILGRFGDDDAAAARAILDYALHHAASDDGRVPYAQWPDAIKGHFIARIPPPGYLAT